MLSCSLTLEDGVDHTIRHHTSYGELFGGGSDMLCVDLVNLVCQSIMELTRVVRSGIEYDGEHTLMVALRCQENSWIWRCFFPPRCCTHRSPTHSLTHSAHSVEKKSRVEFEPAILVCCTEGRQSPLPRTEKLWISLSFVLC